MKQELNVLSDSVLQLLKIDEAGTSVDFFPIQHQQYCRSGVDSVLSCYKWHLCDVSIEGTKRWKAVCDPFHLVEHDIADSTIGSLDVEETKPVVRQRLLNVIYVGQMFH